jgi:hypothetical protein
MTRCKPVRAQLGYAHMSSSGSLLPSVGWRPNTRRDWYTLRRALNFYLGKAEMMLGRTHLLSYPYELCVDVSNKCNLHCPFCPTGRGEQGRPRGNVS